MLQERYTFQRQMESIRLLLWRKALPYKQEINQPKTEAFKVEKQDIDEQISGGAKNPF